MNNPGRYLVLYPTGQASPLPNPNNPTQAEGAFPFSANPGDQFTYLAVTGLNPATGAAAGGDTVQVIGSGLAGATTVSFGPNVGTDLLVAPDGNSLTVKVPAGSGTVDVKVTTLTSDLNNPFAVALLPDGKFLVTEKLPGGAFSGFKAASWRWSRQIKCHSRMNSIECLNGLAASTFVAIKSPPGASRS